MIQLIQLLPGQNAAKFRAGGANVLVRILGGDETLIDDIRGIANHHALGASEGTVGQLFNEAVNVPQVQPVPPPQPIIHKYSMLSPAMVGRTIDEFFNQNVVYLIIFTIACKQHIKFGETGNFEQRLKDHLRDFKDCNPIVWCVYETTQSLKVEKDFKSKMKYSSLLSPMRINNIYQSEVITGIDPIDAENILKETVLRYNQNDNEDSYKMKELDVWMARLDCVKHVIPKLGAIDNTILTQLISMMSDVRD